MGEGLVEAVALGGGELLGVVGLGEGPGGEGGEVGLGNLDGGGDDGPGEAAAPGLVDADEGVAGVGGPVGAFGLEVGGHGRTRAVRS